MLLQFIYFELLTRYYRFHECSNIPLPSNPTPKSIMEIVLRRTTRNFSGQGRFLGIGALRQTLPVRHRKEEPAGENFGIFFQDTLQPAF